MKQIILQRLNDIATTNGIEILFACESGSRAWGFASPDSDYDVRFIYRHPVEWYLSVDERADTIEVPVTDDLDINGWELRKALKLMRKSNAPLFEWLQSPIVYAERSAFRENAMRLAREHFSEKAVLYHYTSMAKKTLNEDLERDAVKLKKYFYALRPVLAALWVVRKRRMPPMEFGALRSLIVDADVNDAIDALLERKRAANETAVGAKVNILNRFIADGIAACEEAAAGLNAGRGDMTGMNQFVRSTITP